jgi:hypothetical protein
MQSGPTRRTVRPLSVRTAGGNRTRDLWLRRSIALSTELQRYAERKVVLTSTRFSWINNSVDKNGDNLSPRQSIAKVELQGLDPVSNGGVFSCYVNSLVGDSRRAKAMNQKAACVIGLNG